MWFRGAVQVYSFLEKKTMKGGRAFVRFLCVRSRLNYPGWAYGEALDGYEVLFWYHSMQKFLCEGEELDHPDIREGDIIECDGHLSCFTYVGKTGRVWVVKLNVEVNSGYTVVSRLPSILDPRLFEQLEITKNNANSLDPLAGRIPDGVRPGDRYCLRLGEACLEEVGYQGPDGEHTDEPGRTGGTSLPPVEYGGQGDHDYQPHPRPGGDSGGSDGVDPGGEIKY